MRAGFHVTEVLRSLACVCNQRRPDANDGAAGEALSKMGFVEHPPSHDHLQNHAELKEGKGIREQRDGEDVECEPLHNEEGRGVEREPMALIGRGLVLSR